MTIDPKTFRSVLGCFATGVTVVTTEDGGRVQGMTASAFVSVSLDPPLVLVSVARNAAWHAYVAANRRYAVSVLAEGQDALSNHFAGRPMPEAEVRFTNAHTRTPVLADALAWIECTLENAVEAGDHTLFIGRVEALGARDGEPLAFFRGRYRSLRP